MEAAITAAIDGTVDRVVTPKVTQVEGGDLSDSELTGPCANGSPFLTNRESAMLNRPIVHRLELPTSGVTHAELLTVFESLRRQV